MQIASVKDVYGAGVVDTRLWEKEGWDEQDETRRQREAESSSDLSQVASPVSTSEQAMSLPLLARESQPTILDTTDNINRMYLHA